MASGLIRLSLLLLLSLAACSPVYVAQSAAGHTDLLLRRRGIAATLKDPRTPPQLRSRLELAQDARRFAFESLGVSRSRDFSTYVPLSRAAVTFIVFGSRKTKLEPYLWRFPLIGRFPYKGYFTKARALREKARLERLGYDASVGGAAAYNTPLPFSDPLPSSALELSTGSLVALLIHELAHGTVYFKSQTAFNEAAAQFIGERGAQEYLSVRFGPASPELAGYRRELEQDRELAAAFALLRGKLETLYAGPESEEAKLRAREPLFAPFGAINNADVLAHGLYHDDPAPFSALLAACGGDWKRFTAALSALDRRRPLAALRAGPACL